MEKLDIESYVESLYTYKEDKPQQIITSEHESHCNRCYDSRKCQKLNISKANSPKKVIECKIIACNYSCGQVFHECKTNEHILLCSNVKVHCINALNGCPLVMERRLIAKHLEKCPASIVVCKEKWYQNVISNGEKPAEIDLEKRQLDLEFLRKDEKLVAEWRGRLPRSFRNCLHTAFKSKQPVRQSGNRIPHFTTSDQSYPDLQTSVCNKIAPYGNERKTNHEKSDDLDAGTMLKPNATWGLYPKVDTKRSPRNYFSCMCSKEFRRDEYTGHINDVHATILPQLDGFLFSRCPLAGQGCSFDIERLLPFDDNHRIVYNEEVDTFCVTQIQSTATKNDPQTNETDTIQPRNICDIPIELLLLLTRYLDPLSLSCLSMTCSRMREVCACVVVSRGIVVLQWEKKLQNTGWEVVAKNWQFSTYSSPIRKWSFVDMGSFYNHIQSCPYYDRQRAEAAFSYHVTIEHAASLCHVSCRVNNL